jgi:hypothetical protein
MSLGTSNSTIPQNAIVELLETADTSVWSTDDPNVFRWQERTENERGPGDGQPPELYVWQPTSAELTRISADNDLLQEEPTVEIYIYTLSESDTTSLSRDVISYMSALMSDNYSNSEFADIVPTGVEDFREQKMRETTNHFVYSVEVSLERETETGL